MVEQGRIEEAEAFYEEAMELYKKAMNVYEELEYPILFFSFEILFEKKGSFGERS